MMMELLIHLAQSMHTDNPLILTLEVVTILALFGVLFLTLLLMVRR